ncbi:hypothetical protein RBG61_01470 [Paludicola sp. MB14-C6]|uniref:hypothetical protein n=1 Tax=Paludihabitans sp. MB14-C6 TaxID=3070656 RepID=UPI0027DCB32B|nr:hypothetical protein [Paludicola sp. MB14-C6]WMJ23359.1 hypothetical protein RBG61_01470 [Paludicola sp. MB14-C6]
MNYIPKLINGMSISELETEKSEIYERLYKYGEILDKPRLWDIDYSISVLESGEL